MYIVDYFGDKFADRKMNRFDMNSSKSKPTVNCLVFMISLLVFNPLRPNAEPCATSTGYEKFITGIPEDTPTGTVIDVLDVNGSPDDVTLFQNTNAYLRLDPDTRDIIVVKEFDTDNGLSTIILQVFCRPVLDNNEISITVRVILDDVNDNPPVFPRNHYYTNISEDTAVDDTVFTGARATDADVPGGGNAQIYYTILPGPFSDFFDIPYTVSPDVILKKELDYETIQSMTIQIQAQNNPTTGDPLSATAFLTIYITDVDDLNPKFTQFDYSATFNSSVLPGYVVPVSPPIRAVDGDSLNATIKYELVDSSKKFIINGSTATVSVNDFLSSSVVTVVLKATQVDNPLRWDIALLHMTIIGQGDNAPRFQQLQYEAVVCECEVIGKTIITVTAADEDKGSVLTYVIVGDPPEFSVDSSGSIKLMKEVDFETKTMYLINLTASDGLNVAWTLVKIRVVDSNDNKPEVVQKDISVISERKQGTALTIVQAFDRDPNTTLVFELLTYTSLFAIGQTGEISIIASEPELTDDHYQLVVRVSDNGTPRRETVALVAVTFPALLKMPSEGNDLLAIVLGVLVAVLLVVIVILVVYIIRRRLYVAEQLDRAKIRNGMDPRGLTYRPGDPSPEPSKLELHFNEEGEEVMDVGTSIQDNPLTERRLRYGYNTNDAHDIDEIHLDTAVIPYGDEYDYRGHRNNTLKTFHVEDGSSSGDSNTSDSTGDSNRGLMSSTKKSSFNKGTKPSWEVSSQHSTFGSDGTLQEDNTLQRGEPKSKEKPEITVYF